MDIKRMMTSTLLLLLALATRGGNTMWYQQPASKWMEAAPTGNGRLSAMVYGGISRERLALNEISLWSGHNDPTDNDLCGRERLDTMRRAFFEGDAERANELGSKWLHGHGRAFGTHLPMGDLTLDFAYPSRSVSGYRRELSLDSAVAAVSYVCGGVTYRRECIASCPDGVVALRLTASRPGAVSCTVGLDLLRKATVAATGGGLEWEGCLKSENAEVGGVAFFGAVRVAADGGRVSHTGGTVSVSGADAVTLFIDIRTDYADRDYRQTCRASVEAALRKGYAAVKAAHVADYTRLFGRMAVSLGTGAGDSLPTDVRLALAKGGAEDATLDALFFQYGRYMLIASSRPNGTPLCANLQGVWNDNMACNMAWTCDYHLDINIAQNYWAANRANLAECNAPLFSYIAFLADHGADTARRMYGSRGWVAHTVCNAWGYTAPGWGVSWGMNVTGGAWLATHLWSHYLYTRDRQWLATVGYPLLKRTAEFFTDYMTTDPRTGWLVTGPSISPENGYISPRGNHLSLAMMPTIDRDIVADIYTACVRASAELGVDKALRRRLEKDLKRLPPLQIGSDGQVQEWLDDVRRSDPSHRHSSHLLALFPLGQMSFATSPELMAAARKGLEAQTASENWEDTEWSTANMLCFYARLKDGPTAYSWLQNLFRRFTRENLMTVSPAGVAGAADDIFSFDATEASVAGMCEMLLQSYDGRLDLLPALPRQWADGEVKGLCAEGGLTVDLKWADSRPTEAAVTATADCSFRISGVDGVQRMKRGERRVFRF